MILSFFEISQSGDIAAGAGASVVAVADEPVFRHGRDFLFDVVAGTRDIARILRVTENWSIRTLTYAASLNG